MTWVSSHSEEYVDAASETYASWTYYRLTGPRRAATGGYCGLCGKRPVIFIRDERGYVWLERVHNFRGTHDISTRPRQATRLTGDNENRGQWKEHKCKTKQ